MVHSPISNLPISNVRIRNVRNCPKHDGQQRRFICNNNTSSIALRHLHRAHSHYFGIATHGCSPERHGQSYPNESFLYHGRRGHARGVFRHARSPHDPGRGNLHHVPSVRLVRGTGQCHGSGQIFIARPVAYRALDRVVGTQHDVLLQGGVGTRTGRGVVARAFLCLALAPGRRFQLFLLGVRRPRRAGKWMGTRRGVDGGFGRATIAGDSGRASFWRFELRAGCRPRVGCLVDHD
mmetsp:Transcript_8271/g.17674  ORF Transcript_8271/g.17674 Transcript_8271/m.17674 type:complete len:236 (-) Transcript_8271:840-1547(-)